MPGAIVFDHCISAGTKMDYICTNCCCPHLSLPQTSDSTTNLEKRDMQRAVTQAGVLVADEVDVMKARRRTNSRGNKGRPFNTTSGIAR